MVPRPKTVKALDNFLLEIVFLNGEKRIYDMNKWLTHPAYKNLLNPSIFKTVAVKDITLEWITGEDICPNEIYENSKKVNN